MKALIALIATGAVGTLLYFALKSAVPGSSDTSGATNDLKGTVIGRDDPLRSYLSTGEYKGFRWRATKFPNGLPGSGCDRFAMWNGIFYAKFNEQDSKSDSFSRNGGAECRRRHEADVDKALRMAGGDLSRLRKSLKD